VILLATSAFALALVAAVCGVLALIISLRLRAAQERWQSQMRKQFEQYSGNVKLLHTRISDRLRELEGQTPAKLAAEVAALSDAVSRVADTHRRFAGKVWAELRGDHAQKAVPNGETEDDDLRAVLALQTAKPVSPN
jgi:hypothetical protein